MTKTDFKKFFKQARSLSESEPAFLRALSWFRKGLITEDPLDRFLALWNSIEIVAGKYHPNIPAAKKGSKGQIWECFKELWGECDHWPLIGGQTKWIDENYDLRIQIAHGKAPVDVEEVERTIWKTDTILNVAHNFIKGWGEQFLKESYLMDKSEAI